MAQTNRPQSRSTSRPVISPPTSVQGWLALLVRRFGPMPLDYTCIDIETTGFSPAVDLIVNIGHTIVEGGVVVDRLDAFLDWEGHHLVDGEWLRVRMEKTRQNMESNGRVYRMSPGLMAELGGDPLEILDEYLQLIRAQRDAGYKFVMHGGYNFDAPRLSNHFKRWISEDFEFGTDEIWDTGALEKASQINSLPDLNDTMKTWSRRVGAFAAKGVNWSLMDHAIPKYNLAERFGLDLSQGHGAGFDAYVTHLLFEEFRRILQEG